MHLLPGKRGAKSTYAERSHSDFVDGITKLLCKVGLSGVYRVMAWFDSSSLDLYEKQFRRNLKNKEYFFGN